jgi:hypothetical protein
MPPEDASALIYDNDWLVRYTIAGKVDVSLLQPLLNDPEPDVRELVQQRLNLIIAQNPDHE